jgi:hypothetical protein
MRASLAAALALGFAPLPPAAPPAAPPALVLGTSYPLEFTVSFSTALFHWVDSLAGTSGGKTIAVYQREYDQTFGRLSAEDVSALSAFRAVRLRSAGEAGRRAGRGSTTILAHFLEAPDRDSALAGLASVLEREDIEALRACLDRFSGRYQKLWGDGRLPRRFVERAREHARRKELEALLARIARFLAVDPLEGRPRERSRPLEPHRYGAREPAPVRGAGGARRGTGLAAPA